MMLCVTARHPATRRRSTLVTAGRCVCDWRDRRKKHELAEMQNQSLEQHDGSVLAAATRAGTRIGLIGLDRDVGVLEDRRVE